jgi:putative tryptophan/tyrosine transport system substrate-binding protein
MPRLSQGRDEPADQIGVFIVWEGLKMLAMKRRDFIANLSSALVGLPIAAYAQQPNKMPTLGILWHAGSIEEEAVYLNAFKQGLSDFGYTDGRNVRLLNTFANEEYERFNNNAIDLTQQKVDLIYAVTLQAALAAQRATKTIPVVFILVADPVATRLVATIAQPGGNITGFSHLSDDLTAKRLEILRETIPGLSRVAVLTNPSDEAGAQRTLVETKAAAARLNIAVWPIEARERGQLQQKISSLDRSIHALILQPDALFFVERTQIAELAMKQNLPVMGFNALMVSSGVLVSYAPNILGLFRRSAVYVDRVIKGAKPAELPVELPTKLELFINLKTAKALNITISESFLLRADKVIE